MIFLRFLSFCIALGMKLGIGTDLLEFIRKILVQQQLAYVMEQARRIGLLRQQCRLFGIEIGEKLGQAMGMLHVTVQSAPSLKKARDLLKHAQQMMRELE